MLKALSFNEAFDFMLGCNCVISSLEPYVGEAGMQVMHDALNHFAQTPALWGCDEDGDYAALLALMFSRAGYNTLKPEYDATLKFMVAPKDA